MRHEATRIPEVNESFPWSRVLTVVFFGLLIRIGAIQMYGPERVTFQDTPDYLASAQEICAHKDYPTVGAAVPFFRPPLLPVFISAVSDCHPERISFIKYALSILDSGTIIILAALSFSLFGTWPAILTATCAALYPPFLLQVCEIASEPLFMFFQSAFLLLSTWVLRKPSSRKIYLGIGVAGALAALSRPVALAFPILLAMLLPFTGPGSRRQGFFSGILILFAFAVTLSPWVAFNYRKYSEVILVNDAGGYNLWRGISREMRSVYYDSTIDTFNSLSDKFERLSETKSKAILERGVTPKDRERLWITEAKEEFKAAPVEAVKFTFYKMFIFWRPWLNPQTSTLPKILGSLIVVGTLYLTAVLGFFRMSRLVTPQFSLALLGYLVLTCLLNAPFQVVSRFRIPLADPVLIVLASKFIWDSMLSRRGLDAYVDGVNK